MTNTISVFSIFEDIQAAGFPSFVQQISVLVYWEREENDPPEIQLQFRANNNARTIFGGPVTVAFGDKRRHRTILAFSGVIINEPGSLRFEFLRDDVVVAAYGVLVAAPPPAAIPQDVAAPEVGGAAPQDGGD